MKRKQYKTLINSPREHVWETLWGTETYPKWTAGFSEGSKVKTNWEEGSKVLFLDASNSGMVSRIEEKKEHERMVFRHLGMVDENGKEDTESEAVKAWNGAEEIYTLKDLDGQTEVIVDMDMGEEQEEFFDSTWPKVFRDLKSLSEK